MSHISRLSFQTKDPPIAIYLVQHGRSLLKEEDPQQGLSQQGAVEAGLIAHRLMEQSVPVARIEHSDKHRALQTAQIFADLLYPVHGVVERPGLKPMDDVAPIAEYLAPELDVMLVGHLPFLQKLLSRMLTGREDLSLLNFQNAGVVCLDRDEQGAWQIRWTCFPHLV